MGIKEFVIKKKLWLFVMNIIMQQLAAVWGKSAGDAFKNARYILMLTGTPIRSDSQRPAWLSL